MKRHILGLFLAAAVLAPPYFLSAQATWKQIPIPPLHSFKPQQPKRIELPNGMVIFLQEDHELPLIDGTARIRGGSVNEPANKTGLVDIFGDFFDHEFNHKFRGVARMECIEIITKASGKNYTPEQKQELADRKNRYFVADRRRNHR